MRLAYKIIFGLFAALAFLAAAFYIFGYVGMLVYFYNFLTAVD